MGVLASMPRAMVRGEEEDDKASLMEDVIAMRGVS